MLRFDMVAIGRLFEFAMGATGIYRKISDKECESTSDGSKKTCHSDMLVRLVDGVEEAERVILATTVKAGQKWRNKKTSNDYMVLGMCLHSETLEPMVRYHRMAEGRAEYDWVRPLNLFLSKFDRVS